MRYIVEPARRTPITEKTEVLVAGGGVAGIAAALCAARNGCQVTLIERYGFLGGMATAGLVLTVPPMNNGLQKEVAERLKQVGGYAPLRIKSFGGEDAISHSFDPEMLKLIAVDMLREAGVKLLLNTMIVDAVVRDGAVKGVILENKSGRQAVLADIVIDATGDGDVAAYAETPFGKGDENGQTLPVTLMFNMVNVDCKRMIDELNTSEGLRKILEEAVKRKELCFSLETGSTRNAPGVMVQTLVHEDELNVWGGSLHGIDGTNVEDLTRAEILTREQAKLLADYMKKNLPGFERSRIEYTATQVGVRETRRIMGEYILTIDDLKSCKRFEDTAAKPYINSDLKVPYRCLLPKEIDDLLVAGRCISGTSEVMTSLRLIPPCIATGQAAGTAAALSVQSKVKPKRLSASSLQKSLMKQGVDLGL